MKTGLKQFMQQNEEFFTNTLVQSFFKTKAHKRLLEKNIRQPTVEATEALDNAFQDHYAEIRLTSQLSNNLRRHAIRYDQKRNRDRQRQLLILDQSVNYEGDTVTTNLDLIEDHRAVPLDQAVIERAKHLENQVENLTLYHAIRSLTPRQKHILESSYLLDMNDTEIAVKEHISQQSVTKTRKNALSKVRRQLLESY